MGNANWYTYAVTGHVDNKPSGVASATFTVTIANDAALTINKVEFKQNVTTSGSSFDFTVNSGTKYVNVCSEAYPTIYMRVICSNSMAYGSRLKLTCTCDAATGTVPCTVYYFP